MGVGVDLILTDEDQVRSATSLDLEAAAFKLLGDKGRRDIIRVLRKEAMTMQEVAHRLKVNSGTVFRNINSLYNGSYRRP